MKSHGRVVAVKVLSWTLGLGLFGGVGGVVGGKRRLDKCIHKSERGQKRLTGTQNNWPDGARGEKWE